MRILRAISWDESMMLGLKFLAANRGDVGSHPRLAHQHRFKQLHRVADVDRSMDRIYHC